MEDSTNARPGKAGPRTTLRFQGFAHSDALEQSAEEFLIKVAEASGLPPGVFISKSLRWSKALRTVNGTYKAVKELEKELKNDPNISPVHHNRFRDAADLLVKEIIPNRPDFLLSSRRMESVAGIGRETRRQALKILREAGYALLVRAHKGGAKIASIYCFRDRACQAWADRALVGDTRIDLASTSKRPPRMKSMSPARRKAKKLSGDLLWLQQVVDILFPGQALSENTVRIAKKMHKAGRWSRSAVEHLMLAQHLRSLGLQSDDGKSIGWHSPDDWISARSLDYKATDPLRKSWAFRKVPGLVFWTQRQVDDLLKEHAQRELTEALRDTREEDSKFNNEIEEFGKWLAGLADSEIAAVKGLHPQTQLEVWAYFEAGMPLAESLKLVEKWSLWRLLQSICLHSRGRWFPENEAISEGLMREDAEARSLCKSEIEQMWEKAKQCADPEEIAEGRDWHDWHHISEWPPPSIEDLQKLEDENRDSLIYGKSHKEAAEWDKSTILEQTISEKVDHEFHIAREMLSGLPQEKCQEFLLGVMCPLPAWLRIHLSGFDPDVYSACEDQARQELEDLALREELSKRGHDFMFDLRVRVESAPEPVQSGISDSSTHRSASPSEAPPLPPEPYCEDGHGDHPGSEATRMKEEWVDYQKQESLDEEARLKAEEQLRGEVEEPRWRRKSLWWEPNM